MDKGLNNRPFSLGGVMNLREGLKEVKATFIFCLAFFGVTAVISGLFLQQYQGFIQEFIQGFMEGKEQLFSADGRLLALELLKNNVKAALFSTMLGFIPFLYLSVFSLVINATLISAVYIFLGQSFSVFSYALMLLPHGIFEIPAFLLATAMGLFLCGELSRKILKKPHAPILPLLRRQANVFLFVVIPLLVIAAILEAYVSPLVMAKILG